MSLSIAVIGAGISGPAAAIYLSRVGYSVTVFEQREKHELYSPGILGITKENFDSLTCAGAILPHRPHTSMNYWSRQITVDPMRYVTWSEMHNALSIRAEELGAEFRYGTRYTPDSRERFSHYVNAAGITAAAKAYSPTYTGYVVVRGESPIESGHPWVTIPDPDKRWLFNVGDENGRGSFAFYVKREAPKMRTVYTDIAPIETAQLPGEFQSMVYAADTYQIAPISDWPIPDAIIDGPIVIIGDANGAMRPHTSMGANLGINEARGIAQMLDPNYWEQSGRSIQKALIKSRREMRLKGIQLGKAHLGG